MTTSFFVTTHFFALAYSFSSSCFSLQFYFQRILDNTNDQINVCFSYIVPCRQRKMAYSWLTHLDDTKSSNSNQIGGRSIVHVVSSFLFECCTNRKTQMRCTLVPIIPSHWAKLFILYFTYVWRKKMDANKFRAFTIRTGGLSARKRSAWMLRKTNL